MPTVNIQADLSVDAMVKAAEQLNEEDLGQLAAAVLALRAAGCCEYCRSQSRYSTQPFSVEHVKPRSRGGNTVLDNLAFACQGCNNHRYNKVEAVDPIAGQVVPLFNPREERWEEHFTWDDSSSLPASTLFRRRARNQVDRYRPSEMPETRVCRRI